ncbi:hypothetical protein AZE42_07896 [Rhizopogon vesiculosus]|uniref:Uncharacterized protein n=1 Tax=Rhizopogon vesiculosus TaxID=180088 RepID=A0A1J8PGZ5_9AGAM|nr:hypothetical protein AZE42_07896 [Rhizopogon vesiculosus]
MSRHPNLPHSAQGTAEVENSPIHNIRRKFDHTNFNGQDIFELEISTFDYCLREESLQRR